MQRRFFASKTKSEESPAVDVKHLREQAEMLPHGPLRDAAIKKARRAETASNIDNWANSPELQPPK